MTKGLITALRWPLSHHSPTLRKKQWQDPATLPKAILMAIAIWFCDHHLVILPRRDVTNSKITVEATDVFEACDAKISFLLAQGVVNSHFCMHFGHAVNFDKDTRCKSCGVAKG